MNYVIFTKRKTDNATKVRYWNDSNSPLVCYTMSNLSPSTHVWDDGVHFAYRLSVRTLLDIYNTLVTERQGWSDATYGVSRFCGKFGYQTAAALLGAQDLVVSMLSNSNPLTNVYYIAREDEYKYFKQEA